MTTITTEAQAPTTIRLPIATLTEGDVFTTDSGVTHTVVKTRRYDVDGVEHRGMTTRNHNTKTEDCWATAPMFGGYGSNHIDTRHPIGARLVDVAIPDGGTYPAFWSANAKHSRHFWRTLDEAVALIEQAGTSFDAIKAILDAHQPEQEADGVRVTRARRAFLHTGSERTDGSALRAALRKTGWQTVWSEATYHWIMQRPETTELIHYTEGDIEPMTRAAAASFVARH